MSFSSICFLSWDISCKQIGCKSVMRAFDNTPIIVGVGQKTWREPDTRRTPIDAITEVYRLALADPGKDNLAQAIDAVAMVRFIEGKIKPLEQRGIPRLDPKKTDRATIGVVTCCQYFAH